MFFNGLFISSLGTNVTQAKKVLSESGLPILTANNLDEAAKKAVISVKA